ncbi:MAG: serine/threonine-protein kinase [Planctomycetota bacterium]|nr:serine/threonine-protein kinase [Planctomycetota bacterium]
MKEPSSSPNDESFRLRSEAIRDYDRVQYLFWQAVEIPSQERIAWVNSQDLPAGIARQVIAALEADLTANADTQERDDQHAALAETIVAGTGKFPDALRVRRLPVIANYEILEEIDRGGMGIVYKARQFRPDRLVAINMMRMGAFSSALDVERFLHEANAASQLAHAAVVPVYEVGEIDGEPFIVMKFIDGETLEKLLQRNALTTAEAIEKLRVIAHAIADAHEHGIIHRDLKPSNILIDQNTGLPWGMDFGLAKTLLMDSNLTSVGDIMGTPGYMAPEQATGQASTASPAADVYGLGAILYRILAGRPPIEAADGDFARTVQRIREHDIISPRERDRRIPRDLNALCVKSLETDPANRYQHAGEFAADLHRCLEGESIQVRPSNILRRVHRWARHRPGLAVTICMLMAFSTYHVIANLAGLLPGDENFKRSVNIVVPLAILNAAVWQWWLQKSDGAAWMLYAWATGEVLLLSAVVFAGAGARSGLVPAMFVLVAASSLRFRRLLILYVTILTMLSYVFLWIHTVVSRQQAVGVLTGIPVLLAFALIGLVQYIALNRSSVSFEATGGRLLGRMNRDAG